MGLAPAALPFKQGTLDVDPGAALRASVFLSSPQGVPGGGQADIELLLPNEPSFVGLSVFLQVIIKDIGAPADCSMTAGVEWLLG